jgi:hypothetical protein
MSRPGGVELGPLTNISNLDPQFVGLPLIRESAFLPYVGTTGIVSEERLLEASIAEALGDPR